MAGRILLVRKINRLGFDSASVLTAHYSAYGTVEHVFVPRSRSAELACAYEPGGNPKILYTKYRKIPKYMNICEHM